MKSNWWLSSFLLVMLVLLGCASTKQNTDFLVVHFWAVQKKDTLFEKYKNTPFNELLPTLILIRRSNIFLNSPKKTQGATIDTYYISATEITNSQYLFFLNNTDSLPDNLTAYLGENSKIKKEGSRYVVEEKFKNHPVMDVSHQGAELYTEWLSTFNNKRLVEMGLPEHPNFRLPTFCEWQGASLNQAPKDASKQRDYTEPSPLEEYAWFANNSLGKLQEVRKKKPTDQKIYDMRGNVAEWVQDVDIRFSNYDNSFNPVYLVSDSASVCGGAYDDTAAKMRYSHNVVMHKSTQSTKIGFRICMSAIYRYQQEF